jgi:hypothetical protein
MTASAPISFNARAEFGQSRKCEDLILVALSQRTNGRPIAPVAPAIRTLIALFYRVAFLRLED